MRTTRPQVSKVLGSTVGLRNLDRLAGPMLAKICISGLPCSCCRGSQELLRIELPSGTNTPAVTMVRSNTVVLRSSRCAKKADVHHEPTQRHLRAWTYALKPFLKHVFLTCSLSLSLAF